MFSLLIEKPPSEVDIPEETEEEAEEVKEPDELFLAINQEIADSFALFDKKKNGTFEIKYLDRALRCIGIFLTSVELEELTATLNTEDFVQFEPFKAYALSKLVEMDLHDSLKIAFQVFDPESEGTVPTDRFKKWMTSLGDPLPEKDAKELCKLGDPGNKGFIVYEDLIGVLIAK